MWYTLNKKGLLPLALIFVVIGCNSKKEERIDKVSKLIIEKPSTQKVERKYDQETNTIHIFVALCDNKNQGIVPVPDKIGNGQDPKNNLYWGTAYGIKTYFAKSKEWDLIKSIKKEGKILERIILKHKEKEFYIVADAFDGKFIKDTTEEFLKSIAGENKDVLEIGNKKIGIEGNSNLIAYIGHDGLMDFQLTTNFKNKDNKKRDVIILACYSKDYFEPYIKESNGNPLVWTTGLMAPEAYTIHDAITGYVENETNDQIRIRAAKAYSKYQNCSLKAAKRLLVSN